MDKPTIALIGAPTDIGAAHPGASMGPEALRVAGIEPALRRLGYPVEDTGNLAGPTNPHAEPVAGYRHLNETAHWCRCVRDAARRAMEKEHLPIILGGDHSVAIGSVAGIAAHCARRGIPLSVLWLDAHADFNSPKTSPTGNIHGMPLAVIAGDGPPALTDLCDTRPMLDVARIVLFGVRSIDHMEKRMVRGCGLEVYDMRRIDEDGMRTSMNDALGRLADIGGHLHVSFDVDFLDPAIAPGVGTTVPGGPTYREAQLCMEMIHDSGLMGSLDIMELNPAFDIRNMTGDVVVDLVESLFGEQILSHHHAPL